MIIKNFFNRLISRFPISVFSYALFAFTLTIIYGIIGSHFIMRLNFVDSVYYTVITMATVGYGDIMPVSPIEKIFTITLALSGVILVAYIFSSFITNFITKVEKMKSGAQMMKKLSQMKDHYILCGYGRVGKIVLDELIKRNQKVVVVENNHDRVQSLKEYLELIQNENVLVIQGNATENEILEKFRIEYSFGTIITTGSDVSNLFIVLSLRELDSKAWIVSRASKSENVSRLYSAGANKVISPEVSGANDLYFAGVEPNLLKVTVQHYFEDIHEEMLIMLNHGCTIENIEYHFPGIKTPLVRKIGVLTEVEIDTFLSNLVNDDDGNNYLSDIYKMVNGVHSHWISGPNQDALDDLLDELKRHENVLGVNLSYEEIAELSKKYC